ncbi:hypothetical protein C8J56DRAFT_409802 [Mycena floridula]|nr:hypothetical protein C8J56DRAFT_409802 [Mycena floridula]
MAVDRKGCAEGTRIAILDTLVQWATNPIPPSPQNEPTSSITDLSSSRIYWLNGMAGTGKTAILQSFSTLMKKRGIHTASFFCSRSTSSQSDIRRIFPTLAHALARQEASGLAQQRALFLSSLIRVLETDPDVRIYSLHDQLMKLLVEPLQNTTSVVLVIDGVDECSNPDATHDILTTLANIPGAPFRCIVSSRPMEIPVLPMEIMVLHNIVVKNDIRIYVEREFMRIGRLRKIPGWPTDRDLDILVDQCGDLFVFAFTAIQYVSQPTANPKARLRWLLSSFDMTKDGLRRDSVGTSSLDRLYSQVIERVCRDLDPIEIEIIHAVLGAIVCVRDPMSADGLARLLDHDAEDVWHGIRLFSSVLDVPASSQDPVKIFHSSFSDYLTSSTRSRDFAIDASQQHTVLAVASLEVLKDQLGENVSNQSVQPHLRYAALYFATHLDMSGPSDPEYKSSLIQDVLTIHLLHWLECCSSLKRLDTALDDLGKISVFLTRHPHPDTWYLQQILDEARRLVVENFALISEFPLELYRSALIWLPKRSIIRSQYADKVQQTLPQVILGLSETWGVCEQVIYASDPISTVAVSSNKVVSGSSDGSVSVWSASTGERRNVLLGHTGSITAVAVSKDGTTIISGSEDGSVLVWTVESGVYETILSGEDSGSIRSVTISESDAGYVMAACDRDGVRVWNKVEIISLTSTESGSINSIVFSENGSRLLSASNDCAVHIWDLATRTESSVLYGHTHWVYSAAFSSDGSLVVSGSRDTTVRIWSVESGQSSRVLQGHSLQVNSVSFSSDDSTVVSGSNDGTVRTWDVATGTVLRILHGHSFWVNSVSFLGEGLRLVSASQDSTLRVWNLAHDDVQSVSERHTDRIKSVALSRDGTRCVTGSNDCTVRLWNTLSGRTMQLLRGHSHWVNSVAMSQDSCRLASASQDGTVIIWNAITGHLHSKFIGHEDAVTSVALSSKLGVSGSYDCTVRTWNIDTGYQYRVFHGNLLWVTAVAFSSDGDRVASGSKDGFARIWDVMTGESIAVIDPGYHGLRSSIHSISFLPGDSSIVFGTDSGCRIWNLPGHILERTLDIHDSVILADNSLLSCTFRGSFDISKGASLVLSRERDRIVRKRVTDKMVPAGIDVGTVCWIPTSQRVSSWSGYSYSDSIFILIHTSGDMNILDFSPIDN